MFASCHCHCGDIDGSDASRSLPGTNHWHWHCFKVHFNWPVIIQCFLFLFVLHLPNTPATRTCRSFRNYWTQSWRWCRAHQLWKWLQRQPKTWAERALPCCCFGRKRLNMRGQGNSWWSRALSYGGEAPFLSFQFASATFIDSFVILRPLYFINIINANCL